MADVVVFPGSTDHIETEDVNLLDADTAHGAQSVGRWEQFQAMTNPVTVPSPDAPVGPNVFQAAASTDTASGRIWAGEDSAAVTAATEYTFAVDLLAAAASRTGTAFFYWYDSGGGYLSNSSGSGVSLVNGTWTRVSLTATAPASVASVGVRFYVTGGMLSGEVLQWRSPICAEGTDTTFVPSLRIVGTLGETIDPVDMPIVYAADGTPLTVGEGWAGEGVEYTRYDGDVGVGPVVAQFLASDLP